jgi:hypothetical protein
MIKFSKPCKDIIQIKKSFFENEPEFIKKQAIIDFHYRNQKKRRVCVLCGAPLKGDAYKRKNISYLKCSACTHVNGAHEDSEAFCNVVYSDNQVNYAAVYNDKNSRLLWKRVNSIYIPKAKFLIKVLKEERKPIQSLQFMDFGCGMGYFVMAMKKLGVKRVMGFDVSNHQTTLGNKILRLNGYESCLHSMSLQEGKQKIMEDQWDVLSMIGVLEHLRDLRSHLECLRKNKRLKYFFVSVPLFSLSNFIESVFDKNFHRQTYGGHTHFFTAKSIDHLCREFGFRKVSEWWFGTDMIDLYRFLYLNMENNPKFKLRFSQAVVPLIDKLQAVLDNAKFCSEVHLVLKKRA